MPDAGDGYQILTLDEVEPVFAHQQQAKLLTLRRLLGYRAAGVNAWTGDTGERVVPPHEEESGNEELYVVVRGRAAFTVGDEVADAPAGTLVHVPGETHRTATAAEDGTIVLAVGGRPGEAFQIYGWEDWAVADALRREGRLDEGRAVLTASIEAAPDFWGLQYNFGCWESLVGNADAAFERLRQALTLDESEVRKWAKDDSDLDPIRDDPRWRELFG
jgi:mannose-6-phosphate isomerase-like protein (cupin superfamily)